LKREIDEEHNKMIYSNINSTYLRSALYRFEASRSRITSTWTASYDGGGAEGMIIKRNKNNESKEVKKNTISTVLLKFNRLV